MKALAEALLEAFWASGWGPGLLKVFVGVSIASVFLIPALRPYLRSKLPVLRDARSTAALQFLVHGVLLGVTIALGKAVCVDRVVSNPWGSFRAHGHLLETPTLLFILAVYGVIDGAALAGAGNSQVRPWELTRRVHRLGGFVDTCVCMPVFVGTCWEMALSLHRIVPWVSGLEVWLVPLVALGLILWCLQSVASPGMQQPFTGAQKERKKNRR
jgi:hypothetical protein